MKKSFEEYFMYCEREDEDEILIDDCYKRISGFAPQDYDSFDNRDYYRYNDDDLYEAAF